MKKNLLFLCFILNVSFVNAQNETINLASMNLKASIKSVTEIVYKGIEKFGEAEKAEKINKYYYEFDQAGYLTTEERKGLEYKWEIKEKYKYDNNHRQIEQSYEEDGEKTVGKIKYNAQGKEVEINIYDGKGKLLFKIKNDYASDDTANILFFDISNKYNAAGELLETTTSVLGDYKLIQNEKTGETSSEYKIKDDRGNVIKLVKNKGKNDSTVYEYRYNAKNEKIEESYVTSKYKHLIKTNYKYDTYGNLTEVTDSNDKRVTYSYSYDNQNNWIHSVKKEEFIGNITFEITERTIKYH